MKSNLTLPGLVLVVMSAALLVLSGCSDNGSNNIKGGGSTPPPATPATTIFPAINPPFDEITEVAVSPAPGGPFDDVLEPDTDYTYDPATESITSTSSVDPGGAYVRITGLATVTGTQSSYTVYTYIASEGDRVAANELTSAAVGLVASGDAADFEEALGLVEAEFGLPVGSVADAGTETNPITADERSAKLISVLAAAAPAFADDADPAFDVNNFTTADLEDGRVAYLDCVVLGGLAYDSWHKTDAGGSALPADEGDNDYTRCKACHGWDQQGTDGGYVRRSRNAGRANAGYQDPNNCGDPPEPGCTPSRNISTDAIFGRGSAIGIPAGGRTWAEGSAVFDMVDPSWGPGAILGNRHPDLSAANPEGPTAQQLSCLTAFLNAPEARADQVYSGIETMPADGSPAIYTPVSTANADVGETYYVDSCQGCHGDPSADSTNPALTGGLIGYLNSDGKFSEFMHKMHWGIPNTSMNRAAMGDPTAADVANVVAYMQAVPFMGISAAQVVPAVAAFDPLDPARGSGTYTYTLGSGLEYTITITGTLSSPITEAHFHLGRVGTNGDPIHTLEPFDAGQSTGIWTGLSAEQQADLLAGNVYVNIHTDDNPDGEIRGQVKAVTGNQPPVAVASSDLQDVDPGTLVTLDGSDSSDTDGPQALTYAWTLVAPGGSTATLSDDTAVSPTFTADVEGGYLATLTVNDGLANDTAEVTVTASAAPLDGVALYGEHCSSCHNPLATSTKAGRTAAQIQAAIDNNVGGMGGLSFLTAEEVQAIADALAQ